MSTQDSLLTATVEKLFGDIAAALSPADAARLEQGNLLIEAWQLIEENGIAAVMLSEAEGGFGGTWQDATTVARLAAYNALPLPIVETVLAQYVLGIAGLEIPTGPIALAIGNELQINHDSARVSGRIENVAWAGATAHVLVAARDGAIALIEQSAITDIVKRHNLAGEPTADIHFTQTTTIASGTVDADVFALRALLCVAQIAGGLSAALMQSVNHANERQQFGKPIGQFQAIQQTLAVFADEVAAINCASLAASRAAEFGDAKFEIAAAKLRANRAIGVATSIAHQVHGAIGFTREHALHLHTQRLWQWRSDFGNDRHWAHVLGAIVAQRGAANFWGDMATRGDRC